MYPHLFGGAFEIPTFTLMITLGALVALGVFFIQIKRYKIDSEITEKLLLMIPIMFLGGFFFAMVYDKIAHWGEDVWYKPAGLAFAGGFVGAFVLFLAFYPLIIKKPNRDIILHLDIFTPCIILAHSFGRIGCFLGGCCYGKPTDSIFGVMFPEHSLAHAQYGAVKVFPTQLFESFFLLVLFCALFFFIRRYKISIYLISYGVFRFLIEFLRGDNRGSISAVLSPSQILSIIIVLGGIVSFFLYKKHQTQRHKQLLVPPAKTSDDFVKTDKTD